MGYTLLPPGSQGWKTNDYRSQLLTLYDRPHNFIRKLKCECAQVFDAKLNVLVSIENFLWFLQFFVFYREQYQVT